MIESKLLKKTNLVNHGFFNKMNGVSKGVYKSLNCGKGSWDNKKNVEKNLRYVKGKILSRKNSIVLLYQIHSSKFFYLKKIPKRKLIGDGFITNIKNLPLGILTADCAPILILDAKKKIIAAIHAGWKGAYKNIVIKVLRKFTNLGSKKKDIIAVIGPCIAKQSYEVQNDFFKIFINQKKKNKNFFTFKKKKIFFSLNEYIKSQLENSGIKNIEIIKKDTYLDKNNFFSSRRSLNNNFDDYGRNISIIMIK